MASADPSDPPPTGHPSAPAEPGAEWRWLSIRLFVFLVLLTLLSTAGNPVASTTRGREKARPFIQELFPDRPVTPEDSLTVPVAVVFHLIRSGEPGVARRALDFAAENRFAKAAPYVIERLEDDFGRVAAGRQG